MRQRIRNAKIEKHSRSFSFNFEHEKSFYSFLFARNHTAKNSRDITARKGEKGRKRTRWNVQAEGNRPVFIVRLPEAAILALHCHRAALHRK